MINKIHFGKRMSVLRRKACLSQTDLAEKLGVTSQAVSKWECGNAVPDIDILLELLIHHDSFRRISINGDFILDSASIDRRVTTEKKKQKALKTQCFQGFLVAFPPGVEPEIAP